jgi:Flp pilus assembly protein TadG
VRRAMPNRSTAKGGIRTGRRGGVSRSQSGQALLEAALVTPLLLLMLVGTVELGRYAYLGILVGNAARAGAAYGAQGLAQSGDLIGIQLAADNDFKSNGQPASALTVSSSNSCGCDNGGTITTAGCNPATNPSAGTCSGGGHWVVMVSVTASGMFTPLFNYPGVSNSITISRTSTIRVAQS